MKLSVTRQSIARCLKIILGNFLITGAYAFITVPNEIANGGVTSFSMILGNWKEIFHRNRIQLFLLSHPVFRPARSGICNPGSSGHRHGSGRDRLYCSSVADAELPFEKERVIAVPFPTSLSVRI